MTTRLHFIEAHASHQPETFAQAVITGLSQPQKSLPSRLFYDTAGSQLFERICQLPEYYLTRTEQSILERYAPTISEAIGSNVVLAEFGSGNSCKTRILIEALLERQPSLQYIPIDISRDFLRSSALTLLEEYPPLCITAIAGEYNDGIQVLPEHDGPRLILFLGSNIGNFEREEAIAFLGRIRARMNAQDRILIGVDRIKDRAVLVAAYNDSLGVTGAFNKNLLRRVNLELDADFRLPQFTHYAPFVEAQSRIEMRLISLCPQTVTLNRAGKTVQFAEGEYIHTENSHKYTLSDFQQVCGAAGLTIEARWLDDQEWFAVLLLKPRDVPENVD